MRITRILLVWVMALPLLVSCKKDSQGINMSISSFTPSIGAPGYVVTIKGKGFGYSVTPLRLTFNGTDANITALTDTSIGTKVPQNATTGKITLSMNGQTVSSSKDFTILKGSWVQKKICLFPVKC